MRHGTFERILIFNRDHEVALVDDGEGNMTKHVVNTDKFLFQRILNIILIACSFADIDRVGEIAIYERVQRPSYANLDQIIAMEEAKGTIKKASKEPFVNFVVENVKIFSDKPVQYKKPPFYDKEVNMQHQIWPGRHALFRTLMVSLTDARKFETTTVPITFQAFLLDKECYNRDDPSYFLVRQGKFKELSKNEM